MVVNNNEISKDVSINVTNKINKSPEGSVETFENCIKILNSNQTETQNDLAITGFGI